MAVLVRQADDVTGCEVTMAGAAGVTMKMLIGADEHAANFNMRMFELAGDGHTPLHAHPWEHEVFILAGEGLVRTHDGETPISAGYCVYVPPDELHQFAAAGEALKFLCLVPADAAGGLPSDDE